MVNKEKRIIESLRVPETKVPLSNDLFLPNHSGAVKDPALARDIANKAYVDSLSGGAPEGTAVKSTGVAVGLVLTSDGDDTSSWQAAAAGTGDMTKIVYDSNDDGTVDAADTAAALTGAQADAIVANSAKISYTDAAKVAGIEAGADVTDTANVTSAGALMDSEVDADIKTLSLPANTTISVFGASVVDDLNAAAARTTLGVDAAGTDNSTDVTLAGTPDYITITGQVITRNQIDLAADVTGSLPMANTAFVAGTNCTLSTNTLNVDDAFIKNNADDTSTHKITAANFAVTGDNDTNDSAYVPMVLHGTDATPPTASTVPRGTIYIQYTA